MTNKQFLLLAIGCLALCLALSTACTTAQVARTSASPGHTVQSVTEESVLSHRQPRQHPRHSQPHHFRQTPQHPHQAPLKLRRFNSLPVQTSHFLLLWVTRGYTPGPSIRDSVQRKSSPLRMSSQRVWRRYNLIPHTPLCGYIESKPRPLSHRTMTGGRQRV